MDWLFDYSIILANGDGDSGEWPVELADEELDTVLDAIIDDDDFDEAMDRTGAPERAYAAVLADVGPDLYDNYDNGDESEDDPSWLFDEGADVDISAQEPDLTDDRLIELLIKRAVRRSRAEGPGIVFDAIERFGKLYSEDPEELALGYAVTYRANSYLAQVRHSEDDSNPSAVIADDVTCAGDSSNRFLACRFAVNAESWKIIACTKSFQQEVFQLLLDENSLEREDVVSFLEGTGEEPSYKGDLKRTLRSIGVFPYGGDVAYENMVGEDGCEMTELIDWLGISYETDRSGDEIYFIK